MSPSTVHRVRQNPDPAWIEEALRRWAQLRLRVGHAIAVDGTRLRGAHRTGKDPDETVSRIEHGTGMPVSILNDHNEGGEIAAVHAALETAPVAGRLRTLDALHTPRETARRIVETQGADGRMTVKGNAPKTFETFESINWETTSTGHYRETPTLEHGRIEPRSIEVFTPPAKMIHDPHVRPIFRVTRRVEFKKSGTPTTEHAYGMTSVAADRASPQPVLAGNRRSLGGSKAITPSATPPSAKTTPSSGPATRPQTTRSSTPSPLRSSSTTSGSCPNPSTASPTPATPMPISASRSCTPSQDPTDRAHTPTETGKYPSRATQPGRPLARPGSAETDPSRPDPRRHRAADVRTSQIADSNASTRAAIKTPIASQQQAWDLFGFVGPREGNRTDALHGCPPASDRAEGSKRLRSSLRNEGFPRAARPDALRSSHPRCAPCGSTGCSGRPGSVTGRLFGVSGGVRQISMHGVRPAPSPTFGSPSSNRCRWAGAMPSWGPWSVPIA